MSVKTDIQSEEDIQALVNTFYQRVMQDELLAPIFDEIIGDHWDRHFPTMYNFWSAILLGTNRYHGNPFIKHVKLQITKVHFDRWLELFSGTLHDLYEGQVADEAMKRARSIATIFQAKMSYPQAF